MRERQWEVAQFEARATTEFYDDDDADDADDAESGERHDD